MAKTVNRIRNFDLSLGESAPRQWTFHRRGQGVSLRRTLDGGAMLECKRPGSTGFVSQEVRCKPGEYYRVEAVLSGAPVACSEDAGAYLSIQPSGGGRRRIETKQTPPVRGMADPLTVRAYFQALPGVREAVVSVGLHDAVGAIRIHAVRFIHILEPEEESHPLALPPPAHAALPPVRVQSVCVCSRTASSRPISALLTVALGRSGVAIVDPEKFSPRTLRADALLLLDSTPPPAVDSMNALEALAANRVVVVSMPAFEKLAGGRLKLRRVEQPDDPIHAKVADSNFATLGFALDDVFPFSVAGKRDGGFAQSQFRKTPELTAFCKRNGFLTLLTSMCNTDAATGHPVSLLKLAPRGAIVVLDLEPLEAPPTTFGEPTPGLHLLLSILGRSSCGLGQFTVPARTQSAFRGLIREMGNRFAGFVVHDEDVPVEKIETQFVTIGGEDRSFGLPARPRPVILVRSGLTGGDAESVHAAWAWFKQLVRPPPHVCPYADALSGKFRLAWVPTVADWGSREGWRRSGSSPPAPMELEFDDAQVAALIDVMSVPVNRHRVVFARSGELFDRTERWLGALMESFGPAPGVAFSVSLGASFQDRSTRAWRYDRPEVAVERDSSSFNDEIHRQVLEAGGEVLRIELPGDDSDFVSQSIARTGAAATILEHAVGLCFGLIAVNRGVETRVLDGFAPVAPGQAIILDAADRALRAVTTQTG